MSWVVQMKQMFEQEKVREQIWLKEEEGELKMRWEEREIES